MNHFIRCKKLWILVDGSKSELELVLTKIVNGKAQELEGAEKDIVADYKKKRAGYRKIIAWILICLDNATCGQISELKYAHF